MRRSWHILKPRHQLLRRDVVFNDQNDHNPIVFEDCPDCRGTGRRGAIEGDTHVSYQCETCLGSKHSQERVHYFSNDAPAIEVEAGPDGWITCPCCQWRFKLTDRSVWTGLRHVRCGQKIRPVGRDA